MFTRSDSEIQQDVQDELRWDPSLRSEDVAISVRDGVVTLAGFVDSYYDKWQAERRVSQVRGVKGIANDIEVRLPSSSERPDPEIARAALDALKWNILVPHDSIKVKVDRGWITLEGQVNLNYQKEEAERAVRRLTGVRGVSNLISVKPKPAPGDVKKKIKDALQRNAEFEAERITVEVSGDQVTLRGTVRSYAERRDAERAAMNAPGVTRVENKITIDPSIPAHV